MPNDRPLFLSRTINVAVTPDGLLQREYFLATRWIIQNAPLASGVRLSPEMTLALETISQIEQEMHRRSLRSFACTCNNRQEELSETALQRRSSFLRRIQNDARYSPIFDAQFGTDSIGYYYSERYIQAGLLFTPDYYVEAIAKVYDLQGNLIWMTEMGLAQPLVDPINVLVGAFTGGTGAVSISGLARSYASIPGRAITAGLQNDFRRSLSGYTTSRAIPGNIYQTLLQRARITSR